LLAFSPKLLVNPIIFPTGSSTDRQLPVDRLNLLVLPLTGTITEVPARWLSGTDVAYAFPYTPAYA
jgi:hypothetical protein